MPGHFLARAPRRVSQQVLQNEALDICIQYTLQGAGALITTREFVITVLYRKHLL